MIYLFLVFAMLSLSDQSESIKQYQQQQQLVEKAEKLFNKDSLQAIHILNDVKPESITTNDSLLLELAFAKWDLFQENNIGELILEEAKRVNQMCKKTGDSLSQARIHNYLADYFLSVNQTDSSTYHIDKTLSIFHALKMNNGLGRLLLKKAVNQYTNGEYTRSIETAFEAVSYFEKSDEDVQVAFSYLQIGSTYLFIDYLDEAEKHYSLARNHFLKLEDTLGASICTSNLALVEMKRGNFDQSILLLKKSLEEIKKSNRQLMISYAYQSLAENYVKKEEFDSALVYVKKSLSIDENLNYMQSIGMNFFLMALIEQGKNQVDSALSYARRSRKILLKNPDAETELQLVMLMADLYARTGHHDSSNFFLREYITIHDSLKNVVNHIGELTQIENEKLKEAEHALSLSREREKQNLREQQYQANLIIFLTVILTGIFSGFIFLYISNRSNKILNTQLSDELAKNQELILEVHHRVKNNLQVISSILNMQVKLTEDAYLKETIQECKSRIDSMALIHASLYKSETNSSPTFQRYFTQLLPQLLSTYNADPNRIKVTLNIEALQLPLDEAMPCGMIANELISNSLKHAFPENREGSLEVSLSFNEKTAIVSLKVSDDGISLPPDFDPKNEKKLGLILINTLAEQLEAKLNFESNNGVSAVVSWPSTPITS
jgi:two-component sensor histidine kinase/tetratricopeptide (TPR) repeat protein